MADGTTAGDYEPGAYIYADAKDTNAIAKGVLLERDTGANVWKLATTSAKGPFVVCVKAALAGDTSISVLDEGIVYLVAEGTIQPGALLMPGSSTAGRVKAYVASTIAATPAQSDVQGARDEFKLVVGRYMGKLSENSGASVPTAATTADIIRVRFVGGR